jgi:fluoride ion exporter CrcB/FEX
MSTIHRSFRPGSSRRFGALIAVGALLLASFPVAGAAAQGPSASLSDELAAWADTAGASATERVIVTFDDHADVDRIDAYSATAAKLNALPVAIADLTAEQVADLADDPAVRSLWHDEPNELHLDSSVAMTGADRVWAGDGLETGYTGAGVGVGVVDTGVDGLHPDLPYPDKVEPYILVGDLDDPELVEMFEAPTGDTYGHGTHVSSITAGLGEGSGGAYTGMAPDAKIYSFKTDVGLFLFTGLLGGFTTFSAFGLETVSLLRRGEDGVAAAYVALSVLGGIGALWLGMKAVYFAAR